MGRRQAAAGALAVFALGLASRRLPVGIALWDKSLGDALYAVLIYLLLALARPTARPVALGASAFGISLAVELFQLTGVPARAPRVVAMVLGTTFAWHDVACYAIGSAAVAVVHRAASRARVSRGAGRGPPTSSTTR